jgi:hypothetical protein
MSAPINRHLTDAERQKMWDLAVTVVMHQTGANADDAEDRLNAYAAAGTLHLRGTATDAYLTVEDTTLVHISREDLALASNHPDETLHAGPIDPADQP